MKYLNFSDPWATPWIEGVIVYDTIQRRFRQAYWDHPVTDARLAGYNGA